MTGDGIQFAPEKDFVTAAKRKPATDRINFMDKLILILALLLPAILPAQQLVKGEITADAQWSGEVVVTGDVVVARDVTLTVAPGTRVRFRAQSDALQAGKDRRSIEFTILGTLIAEGTPENGRIFFTSESPEPKMHDWYGIIIKGRQAPSSLRYCVIEYGYKGVTCYGSSPKIVGCEINYNQYAGISCEIRSRAEIRNCTILGNDFAGLICELASQPLVEKSIITQNQNGVIVFDRSEPDLGRVDAAEGQSRGQNLIINNFETNIYNHSRMDILAQNNFWSGDAQDEIEKTFVDQASDPANGRIIYLPASDTRTSAQQVLARNSAKNIRPANQQPIAQARPELNPPQPAAVTVKPASRPADTPSTPAVNTAANPPESRPPVRLSEENAGRDTQPVPALQEAPAETLFVFKELPKESLEPRTIPSNLIPGEPVIEALLDRKRQYVQRVRPSYPGIYLQTGHEGKVLMEVTVSEDGSVEDYRVLKSDGDLFTEAAEAAVAKFRYKPGTVQGKPVKFKIVEPFIFRINR